MNVQKELEVFNYVKENSVEYLSIIISAITAGIKEENQKLQEQKVKVECGIIVLADKVNLSKIKTNMKNTLIEALKNCSFIKPDGFLEKLKE